MSEDFHTTGQPVERMSKQKTALQQAIIQIDYDIENYEHNDDGKLALKNMRITLLSLLPAERQAIEQAYQQGDLDRYYDERGETSEVKFKGSEQFFQQTYNESI